MAKTRAGNVQNKRDNFFQRNNNKNKKFFSKNNPNRVQNRDNGKPNKSQPSGSGDFFIKPTDAPRFDAKAKNPEAGSSKENPEKNQKKPFDKRKYRLQKYSKKYKLEQWEDKRKKAVLREYYKELKHESPSKTFDVRKIYAENENELENDGTETAEKPGSDPNAAQEVPHEKEEPNDQKAKRKPSKRAHLEFQRIKEEKQKRREEMLKLKAEKEEARKAHKQKKIENFKRLSRKTKKGQPIMKDRIELLLEKIQNSMNSWIVR